MKHYFKCIALYFIVFTSSCAQEKIPVNALSGFETEVDSLMKVYHTVGASVAIVKDGKTIYSKGFGYKDLEDKTPANNQTIYGIASCSKAFTASLFGILEGKGRLSLQDKPKKHIPELEFYSSEMNNSVKLKHILSHSTGMPHISTESSAVLFRSENKNDIIPRLKHLKPQVGVEEEFIYNNYMYALAGRISERVTGQSWEENLLEFIFKPLAMDNTYANVFTASKNSDFATGYGVKDTIPMPVLKEDFPTRDAGGNIYSSVADISNWLSMWLAKGNYKNKELLSKSYVERATGQQQLMNTDTITGLSRYYGFGWMNSKQKGHLKIEHSGGISGYTSNIVFFPEDHLGIVVLTNQNTAGIAFAITNNAISRLLDIDIEPNPNEPYFSTIATIEDPNTDTVINTEAPSTHALENFTGAFFHPGYGTINVTFKDSTLYATFPFTTFRLQHDSNNVFIDYFTERKSEVMGNFLRFDFQSNSENQIDYLLLNIDNPPVAFIKQ